MNSDDSGEDWIVRALGSLDRPVMPDEVAHRLDAAIARASGAPPLPTAVPEQRTGPKRRRADRRSWLIGVAGVAAATMAFALLNPFTGATLPAPQSDPLQFAAPPPSAGGTPSPAPAETEASVSRVLVASQTAYTAQDLQQQVVDVARTAPAGPQSPAAALDAGWAAAADEPAATTPGAAACVAALPPQGDELLFVDRAQFEGQPVLVVVRQVEQRKLEVFVLGAGCTATDVNVLLRATVEAPRPNR